MTTQTGATTERPSQAEESSQASRDVTRLYQEGLIAGLVGAATVAIWFLIIDTIQGRPLYTPAVLGAALFHRGAAERCLGRRAAARGLAAPKLLTMGMPYSKQRRSTGRTIASSSGA